MWYPVRESWLYISSIEVESKRLLPLFSKTHRTFLIPRSVFEKARGLGTSLTTADFWTPAFRHGALSCKASEADNTGARDEDEGQSHHDR